MVLRGAPDSRAVSPTSPGDLTTALAPRRCCCVHSRTCTRSSGSHTICRDNNECSSLLVQLRISTYSNDKIITFMMHKAHAAQRPEQTRLQPAAHSHSLTHLIGIIGMQLYPSMRLSQSRIKTRGASDATNLCSAWHRLHYLLENEGLGRARSCHKRSGTLLRRRILCTPRAHWLTGSLHLRRRSTGPRAGCSSLTMHRPGSFNGSIPIRSVLVALNGDNWALGSPTRTDGTGCTTDSALWPPQLQHIEEERCLRRR